MQITIPFKTPSVNHLYFNFHGRTILSKQGRELKQKIKELICVKKEDEIKIKVLEKEKIYKVVIEIYENWFYKTGKVKRSDVANREKFLVDAVFEALGIDDRFIFDVTLRKKQSNDEYSKIYVEVIDDNPFR
jgi:hypothetical protein